MSDNYDDIINLDRPLSKHKPMSTKKRALQFAPFSALTGYEDAIIETSRLTDKRIDIDEGIKEMINSTINKIKNDINKHPLVYFNYFVPDKKKDGGTYLEVTGNVKKIDEINKVIFLTNGTKIPIDEIININYIFL